MRRFSPTPTTSPFLNSARMPDTFFPPTRTSFGYLIETSAFGAKVRTVSFTATAAARVAS